jgi:DNA-binding NtrC family response regulator
MSHLERIAIADDDPECLEMLCWALQRHATAIHTATTGGELLGLLADRGPFDLVVTDVDMPVAGRLLREIRAAHPGIPIIVATGFATAAMQPEAARLGRVTVLQKPFGLAKLHDAVDALLGA